MKKLFVGAAIPRWAGELAAFLSKTYRVDTNNYFLKHDNRRAHKVGNTEKTGDNLCVVCENLLFFSAVNLLLNEYDSYRN